MLETEYSKGQMEALTSVDCGKPSCNKLMCLGGAGAFYFRNMFLLNIIRDQTKEAFNPY